MCDYLVVPTRLWNSLGMLEWLNVLPIGGTHQTVKLSGYVGVTNGLINWWCPPLWNSLGMLEWLKVWLTCGANQIVELSRHGGVALELNRAPKVSQFHVAIGRQEDVGTWHNQSNA